jgi:carboxypeptidase Taq
MTPSQAYEQLTATIRDISMLDSIGSFMSWDEHTYMPPKGTDHRANQQTLIARMSHEQFTSPRVGELIQAVEQSDLIQDPESDAAANVRELRRSYDRARKLPTSLVEELTRTAVMSQSAWATAKGKSDYATFEPWLDKTLQLKRQEAQCIGYQSNPYDALLDAFEPGETAAGIQQVFQPLRQRLVELIGRIGNSARTAPMEVLERTFPAAIQEKLSREAAAASGFDFQAGRLDVTVHPFCQNIGPGDTRITTRYDEHFFSDSFFSTIHETGHALYEQGLPKEKHFGLPIAEAVSLGIHESQSRMWENFVGRGGAFWKYFFPRTQQAFGDVMKDISPDQWLFAINDVRPSLIRTESDETTYNLHVMLRFEIEQAMLLDEIKAHDNPAAWNERMKNYLGVSPPDDAQGCLQDIHWSMGAIGYFPTYSLGNLYAAQFFEQARKDLGDLDGMFEKGEFLPLLGWLREKIHIHGKRYTAKQLIKRVTGSELSAEPLVRHLEKNAKAFYGV